MNSGFGSAVTGACFGGVRGADAAVATPVSPSAVTRPATRYAIRRIGNSPVARFLFLLGNEGRASRALAVLPGTPGRRALGGRAVHQASQAGPGGDHEQLVVGP